jgi:hypothetical protein
MQTEPRRQAQRPADNDFRRPSVAREIVIPVSLEDYLEAVKDNDKFRRLLASCYDLHPECFPPEFDSSFSFKDFKHSKKMNISIRRIRVGLGKDMHFWRVVPCDVMPYMVGRTQEVEKALFLRKFNVPYWGLEVVFGRSSNYFWRIERRMGMTSIAGCLTGRQGSDEAGEKTGGALPEDICCDEKHAKYLGTKAYIAVTAGGGCVLGAELTEGADKDSLAQGYRVLKDEIAQAAPAHEIKSVNIDGYSSTVAAMREVWGGALLITCILHLYIAMRDGCKRKYREQFEAVADAFWWCYEAETKRGFAQRWRAFVNLCTESTEWLPERINEKIKRADERKLPFYKAWYDRPEAHRVSVAVDRVMGSLDRKLFAMRHLRGHFVNSRLLVRAWAHLHNFCPWNPHTAKSKGTKCPAEHLTQFRYRKNWLENFRVAGSMSGWSRSPKKA